MLKYFYSQARQRLGDCGRHKVVVMIFVMVIMMVVMVVEMFVMVVMIVGILMVMVAEGG